MRGLTAEEYAFMTFIGATREVSLPEWEIGKALLASGRICLERIDGHAVVRFTPAGREAMRLHEFLAAMGAT